MDIQRDEQDEWVGSLLAKLNLVKETEPAGPGGFRTQLEESRLVERIQQTATAINVALGYQALDVVNFLPPQRAVLRVSFFKESREYSMEIGCQASDLAVVFKRPATRFPGFWEGYIYGLSRCLTPRIVLDQTFKPVAITDETIRAWFSFLLSGFKKKFKPAVLTKYGPPAKSRVSGPHVPVKEHIELPRLPACSPEVSRLWVLLHGQHAYKQENQI